MKVEAEAGCGARVRRSGGGLICSMGTSGTDTPFRIHSGFRITYVCENATNTHRRDQVSLNGFLARIVNNYLLKLPTTNYTREKRPHTEMCPQLNTESPACQNASKGKA